MSDRDDTTMMLSNLLEKRLSNRYRLWAAEVTFDESTENEIRIDFMGFNPKRISNRTKATSVDLGTFDCYEVKSCMGDFNSGHGLNFVGDHNYLVCTRELYDQLYRSCRIPLEVDGVLVPDAPGKKLIQVSEIFNECRRVHPASEMLWQMMCAYYTKIEVSNE